jgi:hypothetical protein
MWQGVRREDGSAHATYGSEEEGVGGPPAQALGEREQRSQQWIASLAEGDRVNAAPPPLPGDAVLFRSGEERVRDCEYSKP